MLLNITACQVPVRGERGGSDVRHGQQVRRPAGGGHAAQRARHHRPQQQEVTCQTRVK